MTSTFTFKSLLAITLPHFNHLGEIIFYPFLNFPPRKPPGEFKKYRKMLGMTIFLIVSPNSTLNLTYRSFKCHLLSNEARSR